ncbi:AlpA family phage regulatory protein [Ottowia sp.]|uniref:AlpA family phage regulatory protein n=1 Tax=Ottowia sp. TaxID=1898956 RepID=UPI0026218224|nr:AlpA family phage regulatory protein [Ottowia sp.]
MPARKARAPNTVANSGAGSAIQLTEPHRSQAHPPRDRLLRRQPMLNKVGMGYTFIYEAMKVGAFPGPVQLPGGKAVAWRESEIDAWIAALPRASELPCE